MEERRRRLSFRDVTKIVGRLPKDAKEHRRARHLILKQGDCKVTEDELADVLPLCLYLETLVLSGVLDITDRTMTLASKAANLEGLDVTGCTQITDDGVLELMKQPPPMKRLYLNGVTGVTDTAISAIAKKCANLTVLELSGLPLLTAISVRDLWTFSRSLGTLRLSHCSLLTDQAFPSPVCSDSPGDSLSSPRSGRDKPLPPRPTSCVENLPPLILTHTAEHLRVLDLGYCPQLTDESIRGIVAHAPMIETLVLSGCSALSDNAIESICRLGDHLEALGLAHVANITDAGIMRLARACSKLRCLDVAFCRQLTDMAVFELAILPNMQRLSLVRIHKLTDIGIHSLAEHATSLESLQISYCDKISLDAVHLLLKRVASLQRLTTTGVPSCRRKGMQRFSDPPPSDLDVSQQAAFRMFSGDNIRLLLEFLDKESERRHKAESMAMKFVARADDKPDLY